MVILQLCRWKFSDKETLYQSLLNWSWILFFKNKKSLFEPPFGGLRGNVCTPSIAHRNACGWLPIRHNWTFCAVSYGWDVISGNLSKSAFFKRGGSLWVQISDKKGRRPPTIVGVRKLEWLPFRVVSKYLQCIVWFCHKAHAWQTHTELRQLIPRKHSCSRGKNQQTNFTQHTHNIFNVCHLKAYFQHKNYQQLQTCWWC